MRRNLNRAGELLRQNLNAIPGLLIGYSVATPALAATDIALDELRMPILLGSIALLVIGLVLKVSRAKTAPTAPRVNSNAFSEGIGRYRLQFGRGNAD